MRLFVLVFYRYFLEVFGFEDLAAIETFHVIDAVPAGDNYRAGVLTKGLHNKPG